MHLYYSYDIITYKESANAESQLVFSNYTFYEIGEYIFI